MTDITRLTVDAAVPEGTCGICRRELEISEARIVMGTTADHPKGILVSVTICRACLAEFVPSMLAAVEAVGGEEDG